MKLQLNAGVAIGIAVGIPLLYLAYKSTRVIAAAATVAKDAAITVAKAPSDVANAGVRAVTGDANQTLGGAIFDFFHPEHDAPTSAPSVLDRARGWLFGSNPAVSSGNTGSSAKVGSTAVSGDTLQPIRVTAQRIPAPGSLSGQSIF
jgi:hypothetical protein